MEFLTSIWDYVIPFLFLLTVLVFVHELGHYWVARKNGVRVEVFSVGFGPELFGFNDKAGTRWRFSAIPFGGYVKMFGQADDSLEEGEEAPPLSEEDAKVSFQTKTLGQKAAIVVAGPLANFIFAVIVFMGIYAIAGNPRPLAGVGDVQENSAAAVAGLKTGDLIVEVGGVDIRWFDDLRAEIMKRPDEAVAVVALRNGIREALSVTPKAVQSPEDPTKMIGLLGIRPDPEQYDYEKVNPFEATLLAFDRSISLTTQILGAIGEMVTGNRGAEELGGPIRIAQITGEVAQHGWINLFSFLAAFSINLFLINMLPIPMLDGGHLFFYAIEAIRGRPLGLRVQEYGFRLGLVLVLSLMIFATWNDLVNLKVIDFLKDLVT
ncbi:MAG: RIP metalloprotease RseP [Rhodospirillales bacterium]|nr:RIP metalloprotease RseP [Rhodospirillales bacterium]MCW8953169.1 RIP metalloprotease RseP [Rhodospirillales bacterium]MCW8969640.1 RIP metalloprotease RseP [Rhodospirillales bacterium]MCW9001096.1 RIP metalloprotease RseP [Rhodospirillales bacterium]